MKQLPGKNIVIPKIKQRFIKFLAQEQTPPAIFFFGVYIFQQMNLQNEQYIIYTLFALGSLICFLFSFNIFFLYNPFYSKAFSIFSVFNLFLGILASNQKWKLTLYLYIIGNSLFQLNSTSYKVYSILGSIYVAHQIYQNLICDSIKNNRQYFIGFFTIFCFRVCSLITETYNSSFAFFCIPFCLIFANKLFNEQIKKFKSKQFSQLKESQLICHFIKLLQEDFNSQILLQEYIQQHKTSCRSLSCFCKSQLKKSYPNNVKKYVLIRNLFQLSLNKLNLRESYLLKSRFINFLIDNKQIAEAIILQNKEKYSLKVRFNYFNFFLQLKINYKINQQIQKSDYFCSFTKQFKYTFQYDDSYLYLAFQIKQILKTKINFWNQVGKQAPSMVQLKKNGKLIVQTMYQLNQYYWSTIKKQQQKINNFSSTILYSMYLLSTTNYKELAQSLVKNTSRILQSIKINEQNMTQTYGLKVSIKNCKNQKQSQSQHKQITKSQQNDKNANYFKSQIKTKQQEIFNQVISNVSGSFCKLLQCHKKDLIGQQLQLLIPKAYQKKHKQKIEQFLNLEKTQKTNPYKMSSFLKSEKQVPFCTKNGKIMSMTINIKMLNDPEQGLVFITLIQNSNPSKNIVLCDLSGKAYQHIQFPQQKQIFFNPQIVSIIKQKQDQWNTLRQISSKKLNIILQDNNYLVNISSPYQNCFKNYKYISQVQNENESCQLIGISDKTQDSQPPLHIQFSNESAPYMNNKHQRNQQMTSCIKKIQSVFYKNDIDSQSSSGSRKSSVVNILNSFSENMFIPFYTKIALAFTLITIGCLGLNIISYLTFQLPWDNKLALKNPIINNLDILQMNSYLIRAINYEMDLNQYHSNQYLNKSQILKYYGLQSDYQSYVYQQIARLKILYKQALTSGLMYTANIYSILGQQSWLKLIYTLNPSQLDDTKNVQNLSILNLMMNYVTDLQMLSLGQSYQKTILSLNYWMDLSLSLTNISELTNITSAILDQLKIGCSLIVSAFAIIMCILIIPLFIYLKKKIKKHLDIYDLIVSVDSQQVKSEIKKINNIINIVNKSNQSSQILKSNTVNYLAMKRSSISQKEGGSNQLIQGLINSQSNDQNQTDKNKVENNKDTFRKRSGELNIENSQLDNKVFIIKHWIIYFLVISSLGFLLSIQLRKIEFYTYLQNLQTSSVNQFSNKQFQSLLLLNTKLYVRQVQPSNRTYGQSTLYGWLNQNVYGLASMKYTNQFQSQEVFKQCSIDHSYAFCKDPYSFSNLRYNILQLIKQCYEQRCAFQAQFSQNSDYFIPKQESFASQKMKLSQFSQILFYAQTMNDRLQNKTYEYQNQVMKEMIVKSQKLDKIQNEIIIINIIWSIICLMIGIITINSMKNEYLKEVIIVSFLDNQMIIKNKRVQSFLQTLSKSSY